jgi:hypothetical protein
MGKRPPIDRVREREEAGPDTFDTARETLAQKDAKLNQEAPLEAPEQEPEADFEERMRQQLKETGKDDESADGSR